MGRKLFLSEPENKGGDDTYWLSVDGEDGPGAVKITVSSGMLHIGSGKHTEFRVALPDPEEELVDEAFDRAVEALPDQVTLYQAHYSEVLSDEQIQRLFADNDDLAVADEILDDDSYREALDDACWHVVEEYVDADDLDLLRQAPHGGRVHELFHVLEERDDSTPLQDMARNTGKRFVRYPLGEIELTSMDESDYSNAVARITGLLGIDDDGPHMGAIHAILGNADTAWAPRKLWLLFRADVEDLIEACQNPAEKYLVVHKPEVLLLDPVNGGGSWAEQIDTVVTVGPFDRSLLQLDAKAIGNGMSWTEEISGGGATNANVTFNYTP